MNLGFIASHHNGSNMQGIIDACKSGALEATPSVIISNDSNSGAIERAKRGKNIIKKIDINKPKNVPHSPILLEIS